MVDVCLILEGTYPYVSGGVSSWIHQLVTQLKSVKFGIIHLSATPKPLRKLHYKMPSNVEVFHDYYLYDYSNLDSNMDKKRPLSSSEKRMLDEVHHWNYEYFEKYLKFQFPLGQDIRSIKTMLGSKDSWDELIKVYESEANDLSFLDYFWTWRFTNLPLLKIMRYNIPPARLYHTLSTGFAGFMGSLAKVRQNSSLMLTEHGIYTKERQIEIQGSDWIYQTEALIELQEKRDFFRKWWIEMFQFLGKTCYDHSDSIITLYEGNKELEIAGGADPDKVRVIPNGVDLSKYKDIQKAFDAREKGGKVVIGFVGRVVPIKDVKTLLRTVKVISKTTSEFVVQIIGPDDEDLEYAMECKQLVDLLGIAEFVEFKGKQNMAEVYPTLDIVILSSISEAQPLVILEANAIGIPIVSTNVGSCMELCEGRTPEDKALGKSGFVTPLGNPEKLGASCLKLISSPMLRKQMGEVGKIRVKSFYRQDVLMAEYFSMYQEFRSVN